METQEVNFTHFKHQTFNLVSVIKQLQIADQYDAIIYLLSAINTYLKTVFTCTDREIVKAKISSNSELQRGHWNDVLSVIKEDDGQTDTKVGHTGACTKFSQLARFPYHVRARGDLRVLYRTQNKHVRLLDPNNFTYKEWVNWTEGINLVNKLKQQVKARVVVRKVIVPRPIKRSASLPGTGRTPKKQAVRSMSTSVRPMDIGNSESEEDRHMDSIDYDELILNPELEQKLAVAPPAKPLSPRKFPKDDPKKIIVLENRVIMGPEKEKFDENEENDDEEEEEEDMNKPQTSAEAPPVKKPAKKRKTHPCLFCKKSYRSRKSLMLHFQHHRGFCPDCGEKIGTSAAEVVAHNRQFHISERPIICELCGESFTRNQQYQVHLQNHDKSKVVEEPGNAMPGFPPAQLDQSPSVVPKYGCLDCGMIFHNQKLLEKHILETDHKQEKRLCDICGIDFDTNTKLLQHLRRAHKPKSFTCELCNKEFTLKCNLDRHVKSLHTINPTKRFVCECCGNEYNSQNSLNEHAEMAHKKAYKRRSHLDRHIQFSHNKNGKVARENGSPNDPPMAPAMKPPKNPASSAAAKKKKSEEKMMKGGLQPYDAGQPSFGYEMQNPYGDPGVVDYNNCVDTSGAGGGGAGGGGGGGGGGHPIHQHAPMPMQTDMMYGGSGTNAGGYQGVPPPNQPTDYQNHHHHHHQQQQQHQYYAVQQPTDNWDLYNTNPSAMNPNPGTAVGVPQQQINSAPVGGPVVPGDHQMGGYGDYMQVDMNCKAPGPHQDSTGQLMNIPNSDLFYPQDANMWGAQGTGGNPSVPPPQSSSYNSIGNILTNLELIGNNSNFENSFDIVTSQVDNGAGGAGPGGAPPGYPQDHQQMAAAAHQHHHQHHQYNHQMQYDPQYHHHHHHMNYGS